MGYNLLDAKDAQLTRYKTKERKGYQFQMLTITARTTSRRNAVIYKVDTSLLLLLDYGVRVFYTDTAPEYMTAEEILSYIGFAVQEGVRA